MTSPSMLQRQLDLLGSPTQQNELLQRLAGQVAGGAAVAPAAPAVAMLAPRPANGEASSSTTGGSGDEAAQLSVEPALPRARGGAAVPTFRVGGEEITRIVAGSCTWQLNAADGAKADDVARRACAAHTVVGIRTFDCGDIYAGVEELVGRFLATARGQSRALADSVRLHTKVVPRAGKGCENPNFKGSYLGRFPLVSADFWTRDHLSERSRP